MPIDDSWPETDELIEHHQWRPDWTTERACLYWYLTFENQPAFWSACRGLTTVLDEIDSVDVIPHEWLHLTLLEVGFVDEVAPSQVDAIVAAVTAALSDLSPLQLELGPVSTMTDSVVLRARPTPELMELHERLVSAAGVSEPDDFLPHVSLGYLNQPGERTSIMSRLDDLSVVVTGPQVMLGAVTRERDHYRWTPVAVLELGAQAESGEDLTG